MTQEGLIRRYANCLPLPEEAREVSLYEGDTPLLRLENIPGHFSNPVEIYVKVEGANPTGSFKDRGMTVAVTLAKHEGKQAVVCASTGNTSASAAAYAARAGMKAFVVIPEGKIAFGKLAQAVAAGATVVQIDANFDRGLELARKVASEVGLVLVNSVNPYRLQGQKTAALEILEVLGRAPDYHCLPVGNAGNISAYWMGYTEAAGLEGVGTRKSQVFFGPLYRKAPVTSTSRPIMLGYQASGSAPIVSGQVVLHPETVATAIRIGNPQSWDQALAAEKESGGWFRACEDHEILAAQRLLATEEGIFCEPASAISLAGLLKDDRDGRIKKGALIVCTLTGHGLKDPEIVTRNLNKTLKSTQATVSALRHVVVNALEG